MQRSEKSLCRRFGTKQKVVMMVVVMCASICSSEISHAMHPFVVYFAGSCTLPGTNPNWRPVGARHELAQNRVLVGRSGRTARIVSHPANIVGHC